MDPATLRLNVPIAQSATRVAAHDQACDQVERARLVAELDAATRLARQLQRAMESRAVIEQAKGMLMAVLDCDADDAFDELVRRSQHSGMKLRDVAIAIVGLAANEG